MTTFNIYYLEAERGGEGRGGVVSKRRRKGRRRRDREIRVEVPCSIRIVYLSYAVSSLNRVKKTCRYGPGISLTDLKCDGHGVREKVHYKDALQQRNLRFDPVTVIDVLQDFRLLHFPLDLH